MAALPNSTGSGIRGFVCNEMEEMKLPGAPLETTGSLSLETTSLVNRSSEARSPSPDANTACQNLLDREETATKGTRSSGVIPAEIRSENALSEGQNNRGRYTVEIAAAASEESPGRSGFQSPGPNRQWINGIWYASQEVERRREHQASEMFEQKRKADSMKDIGSIVDQAIKQGVTEEPNSAWAKVLTFMAKLRTTVHLTDVFCSLFLVFVMDIFLATSSNASVGDDIMQGLALVCLSLLTLFFLVECFFNRDTSAPPYLVLEFLSLLSFIPAVIWWLTSKRITTIDDLWQVKIFIGCARAGKIIRLSVTFPRIYLWRLDLHAKTLVAHFAANSVNEADKAYERENTRTSFESDESRPDSTSSKPRSHISLIMNRQMVHHSVLFVCLFYGMLAGYEAQKFENNMRDVDLVLRILQTVHAKTGMEDPATFKDVSQHAFDRLDQQGLKPVYLALNSIHIFGDDTAIDSLRTSPPSAIEYVLPQEEGVGVCEIHIDMSEYVRRDVGSTLYLTIMSLIVIFGTTAMMHKVLRADVILPMERMVAVIAQLAHEPLEPVHKTVGANELSTTFETKMVEMAIYKFASLLQLAFGEAGAGIIRDNSCCGVLHRNMKGKVIQGIFGFCDVRNFTSLTEILQGDVVQIVNGIADVVHAAVDDNFGAPNKNVGDAFLLVWKPKGEEKVSHVAEAALRSYVRTILLMAQSTLLSGVAADADVHRELQRRMPDFRLRLGFGLHYGWAVECAIGSNKKIDASYLSPHVNLASRLEAGTKQFGVDILISAHVYQLFGPEVQSLCRLVDRVTFKGSDQPISIYTYDVSEPKTVEDAVPKLLARGSSSKHHVSWDETEAGLQEFFKEYPPAIDDTFRSLFSQAITFYLGGSDGKAADWEKARELFKQCLEYRPTDGPSATLLGFIDSTFEKEGSPGHGWSGFRNLDEK